jgi:hypothetical protein
MNLYDYDDSMDVGNSLYQAPDSSMNYFDLKQEPADLCPMDYAMPAAGYPAQ